MQVFQAYLVLLTATIASGLVGFFAINSRMAGEAFLVDWLVCVAVVLYWPGLVLAAFLNYLGLDPDGPFALALYSLIAPLANIAVYLGSRRALSAIYKLLHQKTDLATSK